MNVFRMTVFILFTRNVSGTEDCFLNNTHRRINNFVDGEFLLSFLRHYQWGKTIIFFDGERHQLSKQFSKNFIFTTTRPVDRNFNTLYQFQSAIFINYSYNIFDIFSESLQNPKSLPRNWLIMTDEELINLPSLFINHEKNVVLAAQQINKIKLFRIYSGEENTLTNISLGYWERITKTLHVQHVWVPVPSLTGTMIRVLSETLKPHFGPELLQPSNGKKPYGIYGEILYILQEKLNFSYSVQHSNDRAFGVLINETHFNGMVEMLRTNQSDIIVAINIDSDRSQVIDYSNQVTSLNFVFVYRNREAARWKFFFFLEPFSTGLWMAIMGIAATVTAFIFITKEKISSNQYSSKFAQLHAHIINFVWCAEISYYSVLRAGYNIYLPGIPSKIVLLVFHLFNLMMFTQYSSILTSKLTVNYQPVPFRSLDELVDKTDYGVGTLGESSVAVQYKSAKRGINFKVWQRMEWNLDKSLTKTTQDGIALAYREKFAYITDKNVVGTILKGNCSLQFGEEKAYDSMLTFAYRKGFGYKKIFDKYLQLMVESGLVAKIKDKYTPPSHKKSCEAKEWKMEFVRHSTIGLFALMAIAIVLSLLVFCVEIVIDYFYY